MNTTPKTNIDISLHAPAFTGDAPKVTETTLKLNEALGKVRAARAMLDDARTAIVLAGLGDFTLTEQRRLFALDTKLAAMMTRIRSEGAPHVR